MISMNGRSVSAVAGTVIIGVRATPDQPRRARNAEIALLALQRQSLPRSLYRIIVVEQDATPRLRDVLEPLADRYEFVFNAGPYNRGWAFNVGANLAGSSGALCFFDGDLVVPRDFLASCFRTYVAARGRWPGGAGALRPHSSVEFLNRATSDGLATAVLSGAFHVGRYRGKAWESVGCCICVDAALYHRMGGHDERFRGWGKEDKEFWARLKRVTRVSVLERRLLHLEHEPTDPYSEQADRNRRLHARKVAGENGWPSGPIGDPCHYTNETVG